MNLEYKCAATGQVGQGRINASGSRCAPRNWVEFGEKWFSPEAWRDRYCTQAITLPVCEPVEVDKRRQPIEGGGRWTMRELMLTVAADLRAFCPNVFNDVAD